MKYKYLFGPVPSRRLGVSLGVDLIEPKTCTLNCVYCECGATTRLTVERKEYVPVKAVIEELKDYLKTAPRLDFITFAGSGEPTLNSGIEEVIVYLKENHARYPLSLLTNGTLFTDADLRSQVGKLDLVIPSLDAASETVFQQINRPHKQIHCVAVIEGLIQLRREFKGQLILEVFIVPGLNDAAKEISLLKEAVLKIKPDRVQLGTLDRPGTEEWVEAADLEEMKNIAASLGNAELIGEFQPREKIASFKDSYSSQILQTLSRRPCTVSDLQQILDLHPSEIQKYINVLLEHGKIEAEHQERGTFLKIKINYQGYA